MQGNCQFKELKQTVRRVAAPRVTLMWWHWWMDSHLKNAESRKFQFHRDSTFKKLVDNCGKPYNTDSVGLNTTIFFGALRVVFDDGNLFTQQVRDDECDHLNRFLGEWEPIGHVNDLWLVAAMNAIYLASTSGFIFRCASSLAEFLRLPSPCAQGELITGPQDSPISPAREDRQQRLWPAKQQDPAARAAQKSARLARFQKVYIIISLAALSLSLADSFSFSR